MSSEKRVLPPELTDTIIGFLHNDKPAVAACGLVCRAWVPASRYQLFRAIHLYAYTQCIKFLNLLRVSPHIGCYVREVLLALSNNAATSVCIAAISSCAPNVRELELVGTDDAPFALFQDALSRLRSVRTLRLRLLQPRITDFLDILRTFPQVDTLVAGIAACPGMEEEDDYEAVPRDAWPRMSLVKARLASFCNPIARCLGQQPPSKLQILEVGFGDFGAFVPICDLIHEVRHSLRELSLLGLHKFGGFSESVSLKTPTFV